jgi:hypothetical protein
MFWICMAIFVVIIVIEHLLRRRDRRLSSERTARWLAFELKQMARENERKEQ